VDSASLPAVQQAMGHSTVAVTMRYVHLNANATRGPLAAMSEWGKSGRNVLDDESKDASADGEQVANSL